MTYEVLLLPPARRDFFGLARKVRDLIRPHLLVLGDDPRPLGNQPMAGDQRGRWKLRVGDYRVVYRIEDETLTVEVITVAHRSRASEIAVRCRA